MQRIVYYLEVNIICIILLFFLKRFIFDKIEKKSSDVILFNNMILATEILCLCDLIAGIFRGKIFNGARIILMLSNWLFDEMLVVICYLWLIYVCMKLYSSRKPSKLQLIVFSLPLIIYTAIALTNYWNGFLFTINEDNLYSRGKGVFFHWIIGWSYLIIATLITFVAFRKEKSKIKRDKIKPLICFIITPVLASIIQMLFYGVTSIQVGITLSILMLCITNQNAQILIDPLTKLNNRRGLDAFLDYHFINNNKKELTLMMVDIDNFKFINDYYGHVEGDLVLVKISNALEDFILRYNQKLFICRYGGDEFLIAGYFENESDKKDLKAMLYKACLNICENNTSRSSIRVSIGYSSSLCINETDFDKLFNQADENMYIEKKSNKNKINEK